MKKYWELWVRYYNVEVETYEEEWISRPRVRPVSLPHINVNFPRKLREDNLIWTRFNIDGLVSQKKWEDIYLYADRKTIEKIDDFVPEWNRKAWLDKTSASWRIYNYTWSKKK